MKRFAWIAVGMMWLSVTVRPAYQEELLPASLSEAVNYHLYSHAHNDYEHERPLFDALDQRFYSVEADIWLVDGDLLVAHDKGQYKGSLKELYLDPLQQRVDRLGSAHGDGNEFYLWIDIKDDRDELIGLLHEVLADYSMLTTFTDEKINQGRVTVILTGNDTLKKAYVDRYATRYACRDSNHYREDDPAADPKWLWYALPWKSYIRWYGDEPIDENEEAKWRQLVESIHVKGRRVRLYATPDHERYWKKAIEIGVDLINTDRLKELSEFLERLQP